MAQIFHFRANTIARASIFGGIFAVGAIAWAATALRNSSYVTQAFVIRDQPVPFSHEHHVKGLGIDCRYCHTSVEESGFAGIPATKVCMTCHSQVWQNSPMLEPVRESWRSGKPVAWTRVHDLPDHVYFNHAIHVNKGVGCSTCHGHVDRMPLMWKEQSLFMGWCLDCHRAPEKFVRPREEIWNMDWRPPGNQTEVGKKLVKQYQINVHNTEDPHKDLGLRPPGAHDAHATKSAGHDEGKLTPPNQLTNCSVCHH